MQAGEFTTGRSGGKQDSAKRPMSQLALGDERTQAGIPNTGPGAGKQDSAKPPVSQLTLGDGRMRPFQTSYAAEFAPLFATGACLRSPLRNQGLAEASTDLRAVYRSAYQRTREKRLDEMLGHMKERIGGKIGNQNNNAFKLRKLFAMYDTQKTGLISVEAFRVMTESFGMQLDDDSLLALFSRYDPEATGFVRYHVIMKALLDTDSYAQYAAGQA